MTEKQVYWAVPCDVCGFFIALAHFEGDEVSQVPESVPERFTAFCMACGQDRQCSKSRVEKKELPAAAPGFTAHESFAA